MPATRWNSHKDIAAKALKKLAGTNVPASLTRLEQAVKRAHTAYDTAETAARKQQAAEHQAVEAEPDDASVDEFDEDLRRGRVASSTRRRADPPPEGGTPWRGCGRRGIGPPPGPAPSPRSTTMARRFNRKPLTNEERDAKPTATASSKPHERC